MGLFSRFTRVIKAKLSKGLDRLEDPADQLDYAYEELLGERKKIEKAIRDVTADKNMIENSLDEHREAAEESHSKAKRYRRQAMKLEEELEEAPPQKREKARKKIQDYNEAADKALRNKKQHEKKAEQLGKKLANSEQWLNSIKEKRLDVKAKLEQVEMEKERVKSEWRMAQAESRIESTLSGLGSDVSDIDLTISRAKDKVKRKRALASATREMAEEGTEQLGTEEEELLELEPGEEEAEERFKELDREIKMEMDQGPFLIVGVSGGGTWALPEEEASGFQDKIDEVDQQIVELNEDGRLEESEFREHYSRIFSKLRESGLLVGRDLNMEEVSENEELLPEPDIQLPPEDLSLEEAQKMLEGKDLFSEWAEG